MKINELFPLLDAGVQPLVQFTAKIEDYETIFDNNMRGRAIRYRYDSDNLYIVTFDVTEVTTKMHNKRFMQHNWFDKNGQPTMTYIEAGHERDTEDVFFMGDDEGYFELVNDEDYLNPEIILENLKNKHSVDIERTPQIDALIAYCLHIGQNEGWKEAKKLYDKND